jgi:excisionase family DNA binding protein
MDADQPQVIVSLKLEIDGIPVDALPPITDASEYLTAEEAAAYIRVHVETLRKWVRLGVFPHVPLPGVGKDYRCSRKLIDEWARNRALGKCLGLK